MGKPWGFSVQDAILRQNGRNIIAIIIIIIITIIINIVFVVVVVILQNWQVMVTSFGYCWYSGGIPSRSGIKLEQSTSY